MTTFADCFEIKLKFLDKLFGNLFQVAILFLIGVAHKLFNQT